LCEPLGESGDALGERRMLAEERVVRATGDRVGVERRLPPPTCERPNGALSAQVREDQGAVDTLRRKELVLGEGLEAREPLVVEVVACREAVGAEITQPVVVTVYPGDRCRDRIERVAPVDEVVGVLAEARELERLPAVGAELRVGGVGPPAVPAVDGRAGCGRRGGRRAARGDRGGLVVLGFVAEGSHALAQLAEHVGELPRPEDDQHDREDEEKLWATNTRHRSLPREARSIRLDVVSVDMFFRRTGHRADRGRAGSRRAA